MKKQKKCYIYTHVSTAIQVDGYSLDAQKDKLRKYAEYQDMPIAEEFSDEGHSGKNIKGRPEFVRMMEKIESGEDGVEYVLVFKLSRFGRNAVDVLNSLQIMQDYGVNLICVEYGIDSSKDAGKLMISVLSAVAEIERENIRTQTMAGREQKASDTCRNLIDIWRVLRHLQYNISDNIDKSLYDVRASEPYHGGTEPLMRVRILEKLEVAGGERLGEKSNNTI